MNNSHSGTAPSSGLVEAVGRSETFLRFQERLSAVAPVDRPVLLLGERGTGKELAAARLHYLSRRWDGPLVAINCAALSPALVEAELFGHEAGAFTGAAKRRVGRFEAASGGTLFLDEAANIPGAVQEKILRVVEYGVFERLGSSRTVEVDARIVAAANADLAAMARRGAFRADLLDRLAFEVLFLPPLRERGGDIPLLAGHFAGRMALELGLEEPPEFTPEAMAALEGHPWPGNVRELKNVVERAVFHAPDGRVSRIVLDPFANPFAPLPQNAPEKGEPTVAGPTVAGPTVVGPTVVGPTVVGSPAATALPPTIAPDAPLPSFQEAVDDVKTNLLRRALERARFNRRRAADLLGLTYNQFRGQYRRYESALAPAADVETSEERS